MTADDIRAAVLSKIPAIYPSTGRVQSGENNSVMLIASTESPLFVLEPEHDHGSYKIGGDFTMYIYFKDGKVRYDSPSFQRLFMMHWNHSTYGNMQDPIEVWINTNRKQISTVAYFSNLCRALNKAIEEAASKPSDW